MKLAYLTNQYPKVSHSFIRREILALEARGVEITRLSVRRAREDFPDPADRAELERTTFLLDAGAGTLFAAVARIGLTRPQALARAVRMMLKLGLRAERGAARHFAYLAEAAVLQELCRAKGIAHLHVHHATNPAAVALLCKLLGGPSYSLTVHGAEEFEQGNKLALDLKIADADFVATVSEWSRRELLKFCDAADVGKIRVVRNGIDDYFASHTPSPIADTPQLVWIGRMEDAKNPQLLVRAVEKLRAQNVACAVTMLGDGYLRPTIEKEIIACGLTGTFTLRGWANREQILTHLDAARALVLCSCAENVPSVIQEALAQARPVVSTRVGGVDELVQDGVTGWLVPSESVEALAQALSCALAANPTQLQEMGKRGRRFMLEHFALTEQAQKMLELLNTTAARGN